MQPTGHVHLTGEFLTTGRRVLVKLESTTVQTVIGVIFGPITPSEGDCDVICIIRAHRAPRTPAHGEPS